VVIRDIPEMTQDGFPDVEARAATSFFGERSEAFFDLSRPAQREHFGRREFAKRVERLPVDIQLIDQRLAIPGALPRFCLRWGLDATTAREHGSGDDGVRVCVLAAVRQKSHSRM
jgi:hypothetical protein